MSKELVIVTTILHKRVQYAVPTDEISLEGYNNMEEAIQDLITAQCLDSMSEHDISEDLVSIELYQPSNQNCS
jgi:hypothetical protein